MAFSADATLAAVLGLFSGAAGGILTVVPITRLTERTRERRRAERTILGVVNGYRATLAYDHSELERSSAFPKAYADIDGQERFAAEVLTAADDLGARKKIRVRQALRALVGEVVMPRAERRVHVPLGVVDETNEQRRRGLEETQLVLENSAVDRGLLGAVRRSQNGPSARADYEAALDGLERLRALVV